MDNRLKGRQSQLRRRNEPERPAAGANRIAECGAPDRAGGARPKSGALHAHKI